MKSIAYTSPFVPAEWIAAHGLRPCWLRPRRDSGSAVSGRRGVCPYAGAVIDTVARGASWAAVVLATTCDQMRYAGSVLEHNGDFPVFLMNVPSTWQTAAAGSLYVEELQRLGRFLVRLGGKSPSAGELVEVMLQFDRARTELRRSRVHRSARDFAGALVAVREGFKAEQRPPLPLGEGWGEGTHTPEHNRRSSSQSPSPGLSRRERSLPSGVPLALVGGPLSETDYDLFDWVAHAGGQIVLDATEGGERTLPRRFDLGRMREDPFGQLADAYFGSIPDVFRRPNDPCYDYLRREMTDRQVRGVVFRRYLWCDLWHAELSRLQAWSPVPVLDLDVAQSEDSAAGRTRSRIEAFLEMLK